MITTDEIRAMLVDVENDRVERTISTTNTDKFGQAICAFANDLPDHNLPGYLFLGVTEDGAVSGINVTDELLKNIAAIRTDGNIQPQPSMVVQKVQRELRENENGEAVYDFGYQTAVLVCEKKSPRGERLKEEAIKNGWLKENETKTPIDGGKLASQLPKMGENESKTDIDGGKLTQKTDIEGQKLTSKSDFPTLLIKNVYDLLKMNRKIKYSQMEDNLGVTERTIARAIEWLKENGYINPERSKVKGEWQLL